MKNHEQEDLARRTKRFALAVIRLYCALPKSTVSYVLGRQLLKSGTSVGAHYREARRAKSNADFISKIKSAPQELDETTYWLELLREVNLTDGDRVDKPAVESNELISIFVSIVRRVKSTSPGAMQRPGHPSSFRLHPWYPDTRISYPVPMILG